MANYTDKSPRHGKECWLGVQAMDMYALKIASAGVKENLGVTRKHSAVLFHV